MWNSKRRYWTASLATVFVLTGCGRREMSGDLRASAYKAFDDGIKAMQNRDYPRAVAQFTQAIETGGLNADTYTEACICRAVSLARIEEFARAHADLDEIEPHAGNLEDVYAARAFVLKAEGKKGAADQALAKARKISPRIRSFDESPPSRGVSSTSSQH